VKLIECLCQGFYHLEFERGKPLEKFRSAREEEEAREQEEEAREQEEGRHERKRKDWIERVDSVILQQ